MTLEPFVAGLRLLALRGLRADRRWAAGLLVAVATSAALVAAFPPLYADAQDDALRKEAQSSPSRERDLEIVQATRLDRGVTGSGERRLAEVPRALADLVDRSTTVVSTPVYVASALSGSPDPGGTVRFLTLRAHASLDGHVRLVSGRLPRPSVGLEGVLTLATARALSARTGDVLALVPRRGQPRLAALPPTLLAPTTIRISGIVEANAAEPYWFGDVRSLRPHIEETDQARLAFGAALLPLSEHARLLAETGGMPLTYLWRYHVAPARLAREGLDGLEESARSLELRYGVVAEDGSARPEARTGIGRVLERFRAEQRVAAASLSFAGFGFLALALVVVVAAALSGGAAERAALTLARARGGSARAGAVATAIALVLPAGGAGLLVAAALTRSDAVGALLALIVATATGIAIAAVVAPRRTVTEDSLSGGQTRERSGRRRAAVESTLVTVAVAGAAALRTRREAPDGFDVLAAATPLLVVLAAAALVLRMLPLLARVAARRLRARTDLAPTLAARRIERQGPLGVPPVVVPLVATAIATFAWLTTGGVDASSAPLLDTVSGALRAISLLASFYAAAAIVVVVTVIMRQRSGDDRRLAGLGLRRASGLGLGLAQFVPVILGGAIAGVLAAAIAYLAVRPAFTAGSGTLGPPLAPALALVALPLAGALAVVTVLRRRLG